MNTGTHGESHKSDSVRYRIPSRCSAPAAKVPCWSPCTPLARALDLGMLPACLAATLGVHQRNSRIGDEPCDAAFLMNIVRLLQKSRPQNEASAMAREREIKQWTAKYRYILWFWAAGGYTVRITPYEYRVYTTHRIQTILCKRRTHAEQPPNELRPNKTIREEKRTEQRP